MVKETITVSLYMNLSVIGRKWAWGKSLYCSTSVLSDTGMVLSTFKCNI
jgi:hypothetical protein